MKRIIAVMAALMFAAIAFNINVSAVDISDMTSEEYELYMEYKREVEIEYLKVLENYENGNITYDEFVIQSDEIISRYNELNSDDNGVVNSIAQNVSNTIQGVTTGIGNAVSNGVSNIGDIISDTLNPHQETVSVSDFDLKGYGAALKDVAYPGGTLHTGYIRYFSYGIITTNSDGSLKYSLKVGNGNMRSDEYYYYFTEFSDTYYSAYNLSYSEDEVDSIYGDWRYADGTPAPTNDVYSDMNVYNFDNATDSELDKTLQDLNETLKTLDPDLSTMEGLLESIYYRLGNLDSDNDNALLSDINTAIIALSNSNDENAAQIIVALGEIKDEIKNMNGNINDNLEDLENNFDKIADFEIPNELLNVDFDNLSDAVKDKIDDIVELITTLVAKGVPMAAINGGLTFYQDIIFNSSEPQDITFDLSFNGEQYNFTILSTNFFGSEGAQALQIIKNFVAIVLGYAWVLAMRKKAASMMN